MPYYRENFINRIGAGAYTNSSNASMNKSYPVALDSTEVLSFRSKPHPKSIASSEVLDQSADPYAYFLDSQSRKKYAARLKERGLQSKGEPDRGHAFELKRHIVTGKLHDVDLFIKIPVPGNTQSFRGAFVAAGMEDFYQLDHIHKGNLFQPAPYREVGLDVFAQQAYAKTAPTSVVFDAANFMGELNEGLPKLSSDLLQHRSKAFAEIGSDYLNVAFGWIPFVSSVKDALMALKTATETLSQQGQRVHRRMSLPPVQEAGVLGPRNGSISVQTGNYRGFVPTTYEKWGTSFSTGPTSGSAEYTLVKTRSSRRWFEGEFSSFYPLGFDPNDYLKRLDVLVNTKITPRTLYELAPWSWMVDWGLRLGDSIKANELAANDLLVMHYGYAMEETVYTSETSWRMTSQPGDQYSIFSNFPSRGRYFAATTYKRRLRANPYGFKVGGASALTGGQLAILGALGLTMTK